MRRLLPVAALVVILGVPAAAAPEPRLFRIGTVSGQFDALSGDAYRPFTDHLSSRIPDARFEMVPFQTIDAMVRGADARRIDFALASPVALVTLATRHDLRPLATVTQMIGPQAYPWLAGAVFTRQSRSDIRTLADVRGRRLIALSSLALGGWLSVVREWRAMGIDEMKDPTSVRFLFSYARIAGEVCAGTADLGVLPATMLNDLSATCPDGFRVLPRRDGRTDPRYPLVTSTPVYPEAAFVAVGQIDERMVTRLTQELLAIEPGSAIARAATVGGFTAPLSYTAVQALMEELRLPPFDHVGELTFTEALRQHAGKVTLALVSFAAVLAFAFVRTARLNRELKSSVALRRRIFDTTHRAIAVVDAVTLRYIDVNPAAVQVYRFASKEEALGRTAFDVSAPAQHDGRPTPEYLREQFDRARREGYATFEWRHQRPDGDIWDADVYLVPFSSGGRALLQFMVEDITVRKRAAAERARLERQLELSQRMDSIGRLAGAVAHDFNNLLTVINGYAALAADELPPSSSARQSLDYITRAGARAATLTQQLLTFSKKRVAQAVPLDLEDVLRESVGMFERLLPEDVRLVTGTAPPVGRVLADAGQLQQVLLNLVINARDAMPHGGTVTVDLASAELTAADAAAIGAIEAGRYAVLTVRDTGVGIDAETQPHIFEPFFSTKAESGTGLGLATVYGIVRQLHGAIVVSSAPGAGTTFALYFPITDRVVATEPAAPAGRSTQPRRGCTVLVVEDENDVRRFARDVLSGAGYSVVDAASADEALARTNQPDARVDLLLTDVVLRGMNGYALSVAFRSVHPEAAVLFTSGYPDDALALRGVQQGEVPFLPKPYSGEELLRAVAATLDNAGSRDASAAES